MKRFKLHIPLLLGLCLLTTCKIDESFFPYPPSPESMALIFNTVFNVSIKKAPVVFNEFNGHYVSAVYKNGRLYRVYMDQEGKVTYRQTQPLYPDGTTRVLSVVRLSDDLMEKRDSVQGLWEAAQNSINQTHRNLADSLGLAEPIVQFINDNLYLTQNEFPEEDPYRDAMIGFRELAQERALNLNDYDVYLWMDLDVDHPGGGWGAWEGRIAKVNWIYENDPELTQSNFNGLGYAAYHHEIGHVWGWEHEWSDPYWTLDFITHPDLFGWTDLNGDGVVEINSPNAYE